IGISVPYPGRESITAPYRLLTPTFPLSNSTPYCPSMGPAQKSVPRTAIAALGDVTIIFFWLTCSILPPTKPTAPRLAFNLRWLYNVGDAAHGLGGASNRGRTEKNKGEDRKEAYWQERHVTLRSGRPQAVKP